MPSLQSLAKTQPIKLLYMADSGAGKTGALASLAVAGYELFILDFDNGLDILIHVLKNNPEALKRVYYQTFIDKITMGTITQLGNNRPSYTGPVNKDPKAFTDALSFLTNGWKDEDQDFGKVDTWDNKRVLVVDSLSFMSKFALEYVSKINGRIGQPSESDYGDAQRLIERLLALLYSDDIKCNVIVNTHVKWNENESGVVISGAPMALGKALGPVIPRYFNTMLFGKATGSGANAKRVISTRPMNGVAAKCPVLDAPAELPVETGLATFFKLWNKA